MKSRMIAGAIAGLLMWSAAPLFAGEANLAEIQRKMEEARKEMEKAHKDIGVSVKQFQDRLKVITEQNGGHPNVKINLDDKSIFQGTGGKAETAIEGDGANRSLVVKIDGKEISRVPLPNLNIKAADFPPMALPNVINAGVRSESHSINGVSNTKVWVNGQVVYDGPGSNSSSVSRDDNGKKFVEVTVDGKVVYRVGEGKGN